MNGSHYLQTSTLLNNGEVLITGGVTAGGQAEATCELFNPASDTWTFAAAMATARFGHTATLLPNGQVLVTGGENDAGNLVTTSEIYDPTSNTWSAAAAHADYSNYMDLPRLRIGRCY